MKNHQRLGFLGLGMVSGFALGLMVSVVPAAAQDHGGSAPASQDWSVSVGAAGIYAPA